MTDLLTRIANLRADWAAEKHYSPSSSRPPVAMTYDQGQRMMVPDDRPLVIYEPGTDYQVERARVPDSATQSTQIGRPLSSRMLRSLGGSYGQDMPLQRAIKDVESWCRRRHIYPDRTSPEPLHLERGLICPRLVNEVVVYGNGSGEHGLVKRFDSGEETWLPHLRNNYYRRLIRRAAGLEDLSYAEACDFLAAAFQRIDRQVTLWTAGAA